MLLVLVNRREGEKPEEKFWFPNYPPSATVRVGLIHPSLETFGNLSKDLVVEMSKLIRLEPCKELPSPFPASLNLTRSLQRPFYKPCLSYPKQIKEAKNYTLLQAG